MARTQNFHIPLMKRNTLSYGIGKKAKVVLSSNLPSLNNLLSISQLESETKNLMSHCFQEHHQNLIWAECKKASVNDFSHCKSMT